MINISFDFWNTLARPNPAYADARTAALVALYDVDPEIIRKSHLQCKTELDKLNNYGVSPSNEQCWTMFVGVLNDNLPANRRREDLYYLHAYMRDVAYDNPPLMEPGIIDWLNLLAKDENVHILSNTNLISGGTLGVILHKMGLRINFNQAHFSDEVGYAKPSQKFFKYLDFDRRKGLKIHVGDSWCDRVGAEGYGITFLKVNDSSETMKVVDKYLLENYNAS